MAVEKQGGAPLAKSSILSAVRFVCVCVWGVGWGGESSGDTETEDRWFKSGVVKSVALLVAENSAPFYAAGLVLPRDNCTPVLLGTRRLC